MVSYHPTRIWWMILNDLPTSCKKIIFQRKLVGWCNTHLAKHPSNLKQNGTQEMTPFSGTVFHTLSYGVIRFVAIVSFKYHWIKARISTSQRVVFRANTCNQTDHTMGKGIENCAKNGVFSCVIFCLWSLGRFERCEYHYIIWRTVTNHWRWALIVLQRNQ